MRKKINSKPLDIEEVFLDGLVKKTDVDVGENKLEAPISPGIYYFFITLGSLIFLFFLIYTSIFQVFNYGKYYQMSEDNKFLNLKIRSERGIIYDRNMVPLVRNEARFDLYFNSDECENCKEQFSEITTLIESEIEYSTSTNFLIKENLSRDELILLSSYENRLNTIDIKKGIKRHYIENDSMSHILGYIGKISPGEISNLEGYSFDDYIGKEGIEKQYEEYLKEVKGIVEVERNVKGEEIGRELKEAPSSGESIFLNIDHSLQNKVEEVLNRILENGDGEAAVAVAIDPRDGGLLSSVSLPSFKSNLFADGITTKELNDLNSNPYNPQLNRALGGVYPTGSSIKPMMGLAGLEEGVITESTTLYCPEELCVENIYSKELECFSDNAFHGFTDIKRGIAESVNPFFFMIGGGYRKPTYNDVDYRLPDRFRGIGIENIYTWLTNFGWGDRTGIDLPGEVRGIVPNEDWKKERIGEEWYLGDTYNLSIGQGYLRITPLQVVTSFQAIINNGIIYKPQVVKSIEDKEIEKEILRRVVADPYSFHVIREGMRQAVTAGSAHSLNFLPVEVAAKTGTAETGKTDIFHNWITVFAPYNNPEIILTIMVENVEGIKALTQGAAYEILEWYFK